MFMIYYQSILISELVIHTLDSRVVIHNIISVRFDWLSRDISLFLCSSSYMHIFLYKNNMGTNNTKTSFYLGTGYLSLIIYVLIFVHFFLLLSCSHRNSFLYIFYKQESMRKKCQQHLTRIISEIKLLPQNKVAKSCVLILDEVTSKILSSITNMQQIAGLGIVELCRADKKKKPIPSAIAIYFITCQSVHFLFQDFAEDDIFFSINILISGNADSVMKDIASQHKVMDRLASFGQLYIPCNYLNENLAVINKFKDGLLPTIFAKKFEHDAVQFGSELFSSLISSYQIDLNTTIRLYGYQSDFSLNVLDILHNKLQEHYKKMKMQSEESKNVLGTKSTQIIFVVMDRQIDIMAPLIRSFHYLPALIDFYRCKVEQPTIKIISPKIQPTELTLDDPILAKYRTKILYDAFVHINTDLQTYMKNNKAAQFHKQKKSQKQINEEPKTERNHQEMKQIIRQLPMYNKMVKSYKTNINIMDGIGKIKKQRGLDNLTELEHMMISGMSGKRKPEKDKDILQKIWVELLKVKQGPQQADKMRLVIQAIMFLDIKAQQKMKLIKYLGQNKKYGNIATKISQISRNKITKYAFPYQQTESGVQEFYVNRHHTKLGNALHDILVANKEPKKFRSVKISLKESEIASKVRKLRSKVQVVIGMSGSLGFNQIVNAIQVFENSGAYDPSQNQTSSINFITDKYLSPTEYLEQLNRI